MAICSVCVEDIATLREYCSTGLSTLQDCLCWVETQHIRQRLSEVICVFINSYFYSETQQIYESMNIFTKGKPNIA